MKKLIVLTALLLGTSTPALAGGIDVRIGVDLGLPHVDLPLPHPGYVPPYHGAYWGGHRVIQRIYVPGAVYYGRRHHGYGGYYDGRARHDWRHRRHERREWRHERREWRHERRAHDRPRHDRPRHDRPRHERPGRDHDGAGDHRRRRDGDHGRYPGEIERIRILR